MISIIFASTSGRTDEAARSIAAAIAPEFPNIIDLRQQLDPNSLPKARVIIAGTPTYGRGDWHSAWRDRGTDLAPWLRQAEGVFLFGLGSQRHHPNTFCGGLHVLHHFCMDHGVRVQTCGASEGFPGLVLDYRDSRASMTAKITSWWRHCRCEAEETRRINFPRLDTTLT